MIILIFQKLKSYFQQLIMPQIQQKCIKLIRIHIISYKILQENPTNIFITLSNFQIIYLRNIINIHLEMNNQQIQHWQSQIRQIENRILKYHAPSIALFATDTEFAAGFQQACSLKFRDSEIILVNKDSNAKIRCFYYCILHIMYQSKTHPQTKMVQIEFKRLIYSLKHSICIFPAEEIPNKFREFYNEKLLMKLLVQFFQIIKSKRCKYNIYQNINKYPIIDLVFTLLIRSYLISTFHLAQYLNMNNEVEFSYLQIMGKEKLQIRIDKITESDHIFQIDRLQIIEEADFMYIRCLNKFLVEQKQHEQKQIQSNQENQILRIPIQDFGADHFQILERDSRSEISSVDENTPQFKPPEILKHKNSAFIQQIQKVLEKNTNNQQHHNQIQHKYLQIGQASRNRQILFGGTFSEQQTLNLKQNDANKIKRKCSIEAKDHHQFQNQFKYTTNLKNSRISGKNNEDNIHESLKLSPTIQQPKNQFEFNMYDGITSPQVLKFMSQKVVNEINEKKEQYIQNIFHKKLSQKVLGNNQNKNTNIETQNNRVKKRFSMIPNEQIQDLFVNNHLNNSKHIDKYSKEKKNDYCEEVQTNNTFRYSHQTQKNLLHNSKIFLKHQHPPVSIDHHHPPVYNHPVLIDHHNHFDHHPIGSVDHHYTPVLIDHHISHFQKSNQASHYPNFSQHKHKFSSLQTDWKTNNGSHHRNEELQIVNEEYNKAHKNLRPKKIGIQNFGH